MRPFSTASSRSALFIMLATVVISTPTPGSTWAQDVCVDAPCGQVLAVDSVHNDTSLPLREMAAHQVAVWQAPPPRPSKLDASQPTLGSNVANPVVQPDLLPSGMPVTILNFDGISASSGLCGCAPPDPVGAAGRSQYVQGEQSLPGL